MKKCNQCGIEKQLSEFFKAKHGAHGVRSECKSCKMVKTQKWREDNKERYNTMMRLTNKKNSLRNRLYKYKLSIEEYNKLLIRQNNLCAICNEAPGKTRPLAVDHCHKTKKVRSLLCYACNRDMAAIDDISHLEALLAYKKKHT